MELDTVVGAWRALFPLVLETTLWGDTIFNPVLPTVRSREMK